MARTAVQFAEFDSSQDSPNSPQTPERAAVEAMTVNSRDDFAQWAIERTKSILTDQGSDLASAARCGDDARMGERKRPRPGDHRCTARNI